MAAGGVPRVENHYAIFMSPASESHRFLTARGGPMRMNAAMAGNASSSKTRGNPASPTRFVVYRTAQGYWIASTKDGRITNAFPLPLEIARPGQPGPAPRNMRNARSSRAPRS